MKTKLYAVFAQHVDALHRCIAQNNTEWLGKHEDNLNELAKEFMPSGGGFDSGTTFATRRSTGEKLIFHTSFHHMNEGGYYDGWTEHEIVVRPSLVYGITMTISGKNRNDIKDYMYEIFRDALGIEVERAPEGGYRRVDKPAA